VKSVLGSSKGRDSPASAVEGDRASRARLKSSALAKSVSQQAKAERNQERTGRLGTAENPFDENRLGEGDRRATFARGEGFPGSGSDF
jgi:hypothetical protein